jgi:hypothetical protein
MAILHLNIPISKCDPKISNIYQATKALFSSPQKPKTFFKIPRHIESYGTCMEY